MYIYMYLNGSRGKHVSHSRKTIAPMPDDLENARTLQRCRRA